VAEWLLRTADKAVCTRGSRSATRPQTNFCGQYTNIVTESPLAVSRLFASVRLEVGAPSVGVGGAPSRHTGTGGAADGVHDQCLRDSGAGESSGAPTQAARQAARRGDVEQPRRCAGRRADAHRRGEDSPPNKTSGSYNEISASYGRFLGIVF
jgi:hypothetical protein